MKCPNCASFRTRRGGHAIWAIYMVLIALAGPVVFFLTFNAAIYAAVMIAIIALAHLMFSERVCLDCGEQWKPE